jgi:hypothetical protein
MRRGEHTIGDVPDQSATVHEVVDHAEGDVGVVEVPAGIAGPAILSHVPTASAHAMIRKP